MIYEDDDETLRPEDRGWSSTPDPMSTEEFQHRLTSLRADRSGFGYEDAMIQRPKKSDTWRWVRELFR